MAQADIDFEKELWDAANELRGTVSENNYKNYILPEEDDGLPFEEKMESLKAQLLEQFERGGELKERIKANFEKTV